MDPVSITEILQFASGGSVPALLVIIWFLWKLDKRVHTLELNGKHRDGILGEIKQKLDDALRGD